MFNVIIAGSRNYPESYPVIHDYCDRFLEYKKPDVTIFSGTARGVDRYGEIYAEQNGLDIKRFPADWNLHGKSAGYIRNVEMAKTAHALIAFWDGESKGTAHMIRIAYEKNLPFRLIIGLDWIKDEDQAYRKVCDALGQKGDSL